jgi:poly(3-hydroxybutyrate) depolymerase
VDAQRLYVIGHAEGADFAQALACRTSYVAGFGLISGSTFLAGCSPARPTTALAIQVGGLTCRHLGHSCQQARPEGRVLLCGQGTADDKIARSTAKSIAQGWAALDKCEVQAVKTCT